MHLGFYPTPLVSKPFSVPPQVLSPVLFLLISSKEEKALFGFAFESDLQSRRWAQHQIQAVDSHKQKFSPSAVLKRHRFNTRRLLALRVTGNKAHCNVHFRYRSLLIPSAYTRYLMAKSTYYCRYMLKVDCLALLAKTLLPLL